MSTIICDQISPSKYLEMLFKIKKSITNLSSIEEDRLWLAYYEEFINLGYVPSNLPNLLALIHPDFYFKDGRSLEHSLPWNDSKFTSGIMRTDQCQAKEYTGIPCIFNSMPDIRGKCQADHRWPHSLGGPSILDNRLILCSYHNGMKSNDISHFDWRIVPNWLENYLEKLSRLKR